MGERSCGYDFVPGEPKYERGDRVRFIRSFGDSVKELEGEIAIVDRNGSFECPGEPSYDIYAVYEGKRFLFKHVRESEIKS